MATLFLAGVGQMAAAALLEARWEWAEPEPIREAVVAQVERVVVLVVVVQVVQVVRMVQVVQVGRHQQTKAAMVEVLLTGFLIQFWHTAQVRVLLPLQQQAKGRKTEGRVLAVCQTKHLRSVGMAARR
jgi:hypothetical protein